MCMILYKNILELVGVRFYVSFIIGICSVLVENGDESLKNTKKEVACTK